MSKADKMFEELGYEVLSYNADQWRIKITDGEFDNIYIDKEDGNIYRSIAGDCAGFEIDLLKATIEKLKELGWLDE